MGRPLPPLLLLFLLLPCLGLGLYARLRRFTNVPSALEFHPLLASTTNASGVRLRLLPRGVQMLNQVASNLLASQLPKILIPNIEHRLPGDQGIINISKVRMSRFKRASMHNISMSSPNRVLWQMRDVDIGLIGDLSGNTNIVVPLDLTGEAEILAEGLDLSLESRIDRSPEGAAWIQTMHCVSSVRAVEVINHNGGVFGLAVTVFKQGISDNVRSMLERIICKEVKKYIDEDLNSKLAEVQTKSPLNHAVRVNAIRSNLEVSNNKGISISNFFGKEFSEDFFIDYRRVLKEAPTCGRNTIDLGCSGEISFQGLGDTPFGPVAIPMPEAQYTEMLEVALSDFVLNSLLYHAYKQRRLRIFIDSATKGAKPILRTRCDGGFCLGDLIPQLAENYPNTSLSMLFAATQAPAVIFTERNGGLVTMKLAGIIALYVDEGVRKKQIALFNLDVIASSALAAKNGHISGTIALEKFELVKRHGELSIAKDEVDDVALLSSQFIENMLNELFTRGFPLPVPSVVQLDSPSLRILDRHLLLLTDFSVDERRLSHIASAALFPFIPRPPNAPSISALLDVEPTERVIRQPPQTVYSNPPLSRIVPSRMFARRPQLIRGASRLLRSS